MKLNIIKDWEIYTGQALENVYDYISSNINPENAYLIGKYMFFPDILEFKKCFFLKERISDDLYNVWSEKLNGNEIEIEKVINHIHIYDLFAHFTNVDESVFLEIGQQMKLSWEMYLNYKFPRKHFTVIFDNGENDYGPTITFYRNR